MMLAGSAALEFTPIFRFGVHFPRIARHCPDCSIEACGRGSLGENQVHSRAIATRKTTEQFGPPSNSLRARNLRNG